MYKNGEGVNINYNKAFELYQKSADGDYPDGTYMLGYCYYAGIGIRCNKHKAIKLYKKAANLGSSLAQHKLADMYEIGEEIVRDVDQAIYWYREFSEQEGQEDSI